MGEETGSGRIARLRVWVRTLTPWRRRAVLVVASAVVYLLAVVALALVSGSLDWSRPLPGFSGALGVVLVAWWRGRGQQVGVAARDRAVRARALPTDADPVVWRPALLRDRRTAVLGAWAAGAFWVALAAVGLFLGSGMGSFGWVYLAAMVVGGVTLVWAYRRALRRLDALLTELPSSAEGG